MKKSIQILGALCLAILGSALWEALRKPFIFASFLMLKLITLGVDSFRDSIYADAAAQIPERASSLLLAMVAGLILGLFTVIAKGVSSITMLKNRKLSNRDDERLPLEQIGTSGKNASIAVYQLCLIAAMLCIFILTNRQIYVTRASAYANQLQQIAAPFLTEKQILIFSSSFAQTQTRSDYVELVESLRIVISSNKATDPGFAIF